MVNVEVVVTALLSIFIAVVVLTSMGNTVTKQTTGSTVACGTVDSATFNRSICPLENASATSKTMYSLIELIYPIVGVMFMIGVGFALTRR